MRAASTIPEQVSALGISIKVIRVVAFGLGCILAGVGGVIAAPLFSVYPMMGSEMLLNCFVVLVIGGMGSIRSAILASLLVGTAQTLGFVFLTELRHGRRIRDDGRHSAVHAQGAFAEGNFD